MTTTTDLAAETVAGLRRLADLFEQRPDLLDSGYFGASLHPGPDRMDVWVEALRAADIPFTDSNTDHDRSITSAALAGFRLVAVHDEPFRRYLAEQAFVAEHRDEIHGVTA